MKTCLLICVFLVARIYAEFVSPFPTEYDQVVDACRKETGYTDEVVAKEEESYFSENGGLRTFNYCFLDKTGIISRDGELNINHISSNLKPSLLKDLIENCSNRKKEHPESVFSKCFHRGVSTYKRLSELNSVIRTFEKNLTPIANACRMETGFTDEVIAEEERNDLKEDAGLKEFNKCFLGKTGFSDNCGNIDTFKFKLDEVLKKMNQSNVTEIIEHCQSKIAKNIIPDSVPYVSACLHLGVSDYIRSTKLRSVPSGENIHVHQIADACHTETGFLPYEKYVPGRVQLSFIGRNFTEHKGLRKFNDCFLEKTGFITSDGKLNIDVALAKLEAHFAKAIVEHCQANIILRYITDSVQDFSTCYHLGVQNEIKSKFGFTNYWEMQVPGTTFVKNVFVTAYIDDDIDRLLSKWAGFV